MKAELLLLRLEVLKRGVRDVQEVLEAGTAALETIRRARRNVWEAWWFVNEVLDVAGNQKLIDALEVLMQPESAGGEWTNELRSIKEGLAKARDKGYGIRDQLYAAKEELMKIDSRAVPFSRNFGDGVGKQIKDLGQQIDTLAAQATQVQGEPASAGLWRTYFECIQPTATRLFTEYLDLLGGLAIRERGLAIKALADVCHLDELCRLADWHFENELSLCLDWAKPTYVALPGRDLVSDISAWPIVRLGFVSWSIWGLPLEGHEFGKLIADMEMSDYSERQKQKRHWKPYITEFGPNGIRVLIADSIAAWAEGPAYACALLFLALNPSRPQSGSSARNARDADRAELVLATLQSIATPDTGSSKRAAGGYEYTPFIRALEKKWNDAHCPDGQGLPAERKRLLQELPGLVQLHLDMHKPFGLKDWELADKVLTKLIRGQEVPLELAFGVRHLTNAAWRGQFLATDGVIKDRGSDAQARPTELEQRAMKAGIELMKGRQARPQTSGTSSLKESRTPGSP